MVAAALDHGGPVTGAGPAGPTEPEGRWFGPAGRPLMGWLSTLRGQATAHGVLVAPAVGYAYWSSHRTLREIAQALAAAGHTVLRIDYDATGDSAGEQTDGDRVAAWRGSVAAGVAELRELGCEQVALVGVQVGATLGLLDGAALGLDRLVAWSATLSGRRFGKQVRLLSTEVPADAGWPEGTVTQAGFAFSGETLAALAGIDASKPAAAPAPQVLVIGTAADLRVGERLAETGAAVTTTQADDGDLALERPAEEATVPPQVVAGICAWMGAVPDAGGRPVPARRAAPLGWRGAQLVERVERFGPAGLVGVVTEPQAGVHGATVVFLNAGSEPHVGSGRAWVEYARGLAADGHRAVRADFRGWGESPDDGRAPGRPYDAHGEDDVRELVRALRADAPEPVVLVGLCAGAWIALRAARHAELGGVVALNPQLYWQPGDPVEALMSQTRLRRTGERERIERWRRRGAWTALDLLGRRPWAARWLDELAAAPGAVAFVFSEGDDGLEYLRTRLARRWRCARAAGVTVREVPEVDHSAHHAWRRPAVLDAIRGELERVTR